MSRGKDKPASKLFRTDPDGDGLASAPCVGDGVAFAELIQNAPAHRVSVMFSGAAGLETEWGLSLSFSTMARRVGSPRARKTQSISICGCSIRSSSSSSTREPPFVGLARLADSIASQLCGNQRKQIELRVVSVDRALSSLAREIEDPHERDQVLKQIQAARRKPVGLTESILKSLRETHNSLIANEVRDWHEREAFDLSCYSQPLGTVSVTLRRLAASGGEKAIRKGRKVTYKWIGERALKNPPGRD